MASSKQDMEARMSKWFYSTLESNELFAYPGMFVLEIDADVQYQLLVLRQAVRVVQASFKEQTWFELSLLFDKGRWVRSAGCLGDELWALEDIPFPGVDFEAPLPYSGGVEHQRVTVYSDGSVAFKAAYKCTSGEFWTQAEVNVDTLIGGYSE